MDRLNRRTFWRAAAGAALGAGCAPGTPPNRRVRLGVAVWISDHSDPDPIIRRVRDFGLTSCEVGVRTPAASLAKPLRAALDRHGVEATAMMCLGPGRMVWDFYDGPRTIGLVPRETRAARVQALKKASDLARSAGIPAIHTHCGFIPERPDDPLYAETVAAIRNVAGHCRQNGQAFLFETGQETPVTLLRTIHDVGLDNLGVNLDTANLILYGTGNPVDALDVIGKYVRGLHAKDGRYPTDPRRLGEEVPIGKGKVDFPHLIRRLKELDYHGPITIEREIEGPKQGEDIRSSKEYLEKLIRQIYGSAA